MTVGRFVEVCNKKWSKSKRLADKIKMIVLDVCELYDSGTDGVERRKKVVSGRKVASVIRSSVNGRSLQFECATGLYDIPRTCSFVW